MFYIHSYRLLWEISYMTYGGFDLVVFTEIFTDLFCFGRRLYDDEIFWHDDFFIGEITCLEGISSQAKVKKKSEIKNHN